MVVVHVTSSNGHGCDQVYCYMCNENVGLYLNYHHVRVEGWFEKPT